MDRVFKVSDDGLEFQVYLTPGAKNESINDIFRNLSNIYLKISVHSKPVDNKANESLINFISTQFKIAKTNIIIKRGNKSRNKQVFIKRMKISDIPDNTIIHIKELLKQI